MVDGVDSPGGWWFVVRVLRCSMNSEDSGDYCWYISPTNLWRGTTLHVKKMYIFHSDLNTQRACFLYDRSSMIHVLVET